MSEKSEIQLESTNYEPVTEVNIILTSLQQNEENIELHKMNGQENLRSPELKKENSSLRMIVLLELYKRYFNALQISIVFTLYEFFGVITNLTGNIMESRLGIQALLVSGYFIHTVGIAMLCGLQRYWNSWNSSIIIIYATIAQGYSRIAKDLVKLGCKSVIKLATKDDNPQQSIIFKLVTWIVNAKNSVKGVGVFLGAFLLQYMDYIPALFILVAINLMIIIFALIYFDHDLAVSESKKQMTFKEIFDKGRDVNILSMARMFLSGSRDLWFVVPLPLYLIGQVGWPYFSTGALLASWIILSEMIQFITPYLILKPLQIYPVKNGPYCHRDKVAMDVGLYYMANVFGRLVGLILGGVLYYYIELGACLWASVGALIICTIVSFFLGPVSEYQGEQTKS
ncbi:11695_t:CDS:2 [Ambispora leptoticha]|uniref:11695_t:CDS:1 n=1 Tax=Ambispora leptoticha TaxID=144679 RepID=A0A9N9ENS5_9GLOM|nr:11695_t:CDS:2 [Ambispora leptoticha]